MSRKPLLAVYWAASCGGCEISVVNLHEKILDVDAHFDLVFCPCLVDTKTDTIRDMPDGAIHLTLFNGAIRTEENEEMAHLLRRVSKVLVAYGFCASEGCIPALANLHSREALLRAVYLDNPTVDNPGGIIPRERTDTAGGDLLLPAFHDRVRTLAQTVDVDYFIPGCPPESHQLWNVVELLVSGAPLPPKGSVVGAGRSTVCDECRRERKDKVLSGFRRTWEAVPNAAECLLEQGVLCMGPATRDGCGGLCPEVNMPCTGCYGSPEGVLDQGAKMASALGSMMDIGPLKGLPEAEIARRVDASLAALPDLAGTFYKYSLAASLLQGAREAEEA